ncbi:MAG: HD domain-containing protein [archaeon]
MNLEQRAEKLATHFHEGQFRRNRNLPYITHPASIVLMLKDYGITDEYSICIAWMHDLLEDTSCPYETLVETFGKHIAEGVQWMTQSGSHDDYRRQIARAPSRVQIVKLFDVMHNLKTLEYLNVTGISRKMESCYTFYIPLARSIDSVLEKMLRDSLFDFYKRAKVAATDPTVQSAKIPRKPYDACVA